MNSSASELSTPAAPDEAGRAWAVHDSGALGDAIEVVLAACKVPLRRWRAQSDIAGGDFALAGVVVLEDTFPTSAAERIRTLLDANVRLPVLVLACRPLALLLQLDPLNRLLLWPGVCFLRLPVDTHVLLETMERVRGWGVALGDYPGPGLERIAAERQHDLRNYAGPRRLLDGAYEAGDLDRKEYLSLHACALALEDARLAIDPSMGRYLKGTARNALREIERTETTPPLRDALRPMRVLLVDDEAIETASVGGGETANGWELALKAALGPRVELVVARPDGANPPDETFVERLLERYFSPQHAEAGSLGWDLLLLDLRLLPSERVQSETLSVEQAKDLSGKFLLDQIRDVDRELPVILFSATNKAVSLEALDDAGVMGLYTKGLPAVESASDADPAFHSYERFRRLLLNASERVRVRPLWKAIRRLAERGAPPDAIACLERAYALLDHRSSEGAENRFDYSPHAEAAMGPGRFVEEWLSSGTKFRFPLSDVQLRTRVNAIGDYFGEQAASALFHYAVALRNQAAHAGGGGAFQRPDAILAFETALLAMDALYPGVYPESQEKWASATLPDTRTPSDSLRGLTASIRELARVVFSAERCPTAKACRICTSRSRSATPTTDGSMSLWELIDMVFCDLNRPLEGQREIEMTFLHALAARCLSAASTPGSSTVALAEAAAGRALEWADRCSSFLAAHSSKVDLKRVPNERPSSSALTSVADPELRRLLERLPFILREYPIDANDRSVPFPARIVRFDGKVKAVQLRPDFAEFAEKSTLWLKLKDCPAQSSCNQNAIDAAASKHRGQNEYTSLTKTCPLKLEAHDAHGRVTVRCALTNEADCPATQIGTLGVTLGFLARFSAKRF